MRAKNLRIIVVLSLLFVTGILFADKLVLIRLDQVKDLNHMESLNLSMSMQTKEMILVSLEDERILQVNQIPFQILTQDLEIDPVFVVSSTKNKNVSARFKNSQIVYKSNETLFVKGIIGRESELLCDGFKLAKIQKTKNVYRNLHKSLVMNSRNTDRIDQNVLNAISADSIQVYMQKLEDYGTRYALAPNRFEIANWLKGKLESYGYTDVEIDSFYQAEYQSWQVNVIAILPGTEITDQYTLLGAHYDSDIAEGDHFVIAPGANDNASGAASLLETARAMKAVNYQPKTSIRFCLYAMEEFQLLGSIYDANKVAQENMNIRSMVCLDLVARQVSPTWRTMLLPYTGAEFLLNVTTSILDQMPDLGYITATYDINRSDSWSYWMQGYPAIFLRDYDEDPNYHTINDLTANCNMPYCQTMTKLSSSIVMYMAEIPTTPENYLVRDLGNGTQLQVSWTNIPDIGPVNYQIEVINQSTLVSQIFDNSQSPLILSNLNNGTDYKVKLTAIIGEHNSITQERLLSPNLIPLPVENLVITPRPSGIQLDWNANTSLDIAGYRIYHTLDQEQTPQLLITLPSNTQSYLHQTSETEVWHYYGITVYDEQGNESQMLPLQGGRVLTLNKGILVIDDTFNGTGTIMSPSDAQVDDFYASILENYTADQIDTAEMSQLTFSHFAPYSTIIYHRNSNNIITLLPYIQALASYLDAGGNLIISAYKPSMAFNAGTSYPIEFFEGSFMRDYLKINVAHIIQSARFRYAQAVNDNFPTIYADSTKIHPNLYNRLMYIEGIFPESYLDVLYLYKSGYDSTAAQAVMDNFPVGSLYNGDDFKTATFSFPFYQMEENEARQIMEYCLTLFGETMNSEDIVNSPTVNSYLRANFPNPFNPSTTISYYLPKSENVDVSIYNVKGQLVKKMEIGQQQSGNHSIVWNGKDHTDKSVGSGVYFYSLSTNGKVVDTRKMVMIK